jgi:hypothetical protein
MAQYIKPTIETKFHIDFDWWRQQGRDLGVHLRMLLCSEDSATYANSPAREIDWVSPDTGEVKRVDALWEVVRGHCSRQPEFITDHTPLTAAIFRAFVANDNTPLTPVELHQLLGRKSANLILGTIAGSQVYQGIKPVTMPVRKKKTA